MDAAAHKAGGKLAFRVEQKTHLFVIKGLINAAGSSQHRAPVITSRARQRGARGLRVTGQGRQMERTLLSPR